MLQLLHARCVEAFINKWEWCKLDLIGNKPQFTIHHGDGRYNGELYIIVAPTEQLLKQKVSNALRKFKTKAQAIQGKPLNDKNLKSSPDDHIIDVDGNAMPIFWQSLVVGPKGFRGKVKNPESNSLWGSI